MANVPTVSWDETDPAGTDPISEGDDRIRELKAQIREIIGVEHDFPSSGQAADNGQHLQVTLQEQADLGTGAVSATILGSQTVGGKGELVYVDEDDNDIQITSAGTLNIAGAALASAKIWLGNGSGLAAAVAISGQVSLTNAGVTALNITSQADGDLLQYDGSNWIRVAKGSAGQILESDGTDVLWGAGIDSILDYGTSASSSTGKTLPALHVCYGTVTVGANSSQAITNLPFTSATSYATTCTFKATGSSGIDGPFATNNSGAQTTIYSADGSEQDIYWIAIGT